MKRTYQPSVVAASAPTLPGSHEDPWRSRGAARASRQGSQEPVGLTSPGAAVMPAVRDASVFASLARRRPDIRQSPLRVDARRCAGRAARRRYAAAGAGGRQATPAPRGRPQRRQAGLARSLARARCARVACRSARTPGSDPRMHCCACAMPPRTGWRCRCASASAPGAARSTHCSHGSARAAHVREAGADEHCAPGPPLRARRRPRAARPHPIAQAIGTLIGGAIRAYQLTLSPYYPARCRFLPSCSDYAIEAVRVHGPLAGSWLGLRRICRCHPLGASGIDEVPPPGPRRR